MKNKFIYSVVLTIVMLFNCLTAEAILLPHNIQVYLFTNSPDVSVRFDGVINLSDGNIYIPVIPAMPKEVDRLEVVYTYPKGSTFKNRPEVIVFNNNYSLLKLIPNGKKRTITDYKNLPDVVKTGMLPQDILVPTGFYVSENARGLLGNLEVPVFENNMTSEVISGEITKAVKSVQPISSENKTSAKKNDKKTTKTYKKIQKANIPNELNNKMFLVTNFDSLFLKVFSPGIPEPIYGLKLKGILKDIKVSPDKKYLITAVFGRNQIDIADIRNEQIAKSFDIEMQPAEILVDNLSNKAYVLSSEGKAIFIINLEDMSITEKIKLNAVPYRMTLSPDGTQLAYCDKNTDTIYILKLDDDFKNVPVTKCENISKMVLTSDNRLYILSRTNNNLIVNDFNLNKPYVTGEENEDRNLVLQKHYAMNNRKMLGNGTISPLNAALDDTLANNDLTATVNETVVKTGNKPTDMFLYGNKLFVVCSGDSIIDVLNTNTLKYDAKIDMPFKGFPRKITRIDNSNLAIITDSSAKKYAVINADNNKIVGTYPIDIPVNSITIVDKINNINLIEQLL